MWLIASEKKNWFFLVNIFLVVFSGAVGSKMILFAAAAFWGRPEMEKGCVVISFLFFLDGKLPVSQT